MPRVYAAPNRYAALAETPWDGDEAALPKRLRAASIEVDNLTRFARFDVDTAGVPTDPHLIEVFEEATVYIAEWWTEIDDPLGVDEVDGAVKIGSVTLGSTGSSAQREESERERLIRRDGVKAITLLQSEGLLSATVSHT